MQSWIYWRNLDSLGYSILITRRESDSVKYELPLHKLKENPFPFFKCTSELPTSYKVRERVATTSSRKKEGTLHHWRQHSVYPASQNVLTCKDPDSRLLLSRQNTAFFRWRSLSVRVWQEQWQQKQQQGPTEVNFFQGHRYCLPVWVT